MSNIASGNTLLHPQQLMETVGVGEGMSVADLGCGAAGFFVLQSGKMVGKDGRVYAVDIQKSVLESVDSKARLEGLANVVPVWSNLEIIGATKILEHSLDCAYLISTIHQSNQPGKMFVEAKRLLKPIGKLLLVDWKKEAAPFGPAPDKRVSKEDAVRLAQEAGFVLAGEFTPGPYHYGFIFTVQA